MANLKHGSSIVEEHSKQRSEVGVMLEERGGGGSDVGKLARVSKKMFRAVASLCSCS